MLYKTICRRRRNCAGVGHHGARQGDRCEPIRGDRGSRPHLHRPPEIAAGAWAGMFARIDVFYGCGSFPATLNTWYTRATSVTLPVSGASAIYRIVCVTHVLRVHGNTQAGAGESGASARKAHRRIPTEWGHGLLRPLCGDPSDRRGGFLCALPALP